MHDKKDGYADTFRCIEIILWLQFLPPYAGGNYHECPSWKGFFGPNAHRRRKIHLFPDTGFIA